MVYYESIRNILREAGFLLKGRDDPVVADNISDNKIFVTNTPLFGANDDGTVEPEEVLVRVAGVKVDVDSVDAENGIIILAAAPAADEKVEVYYRYATIEPDFVAIVRDDVKALIDTRVNGYDPCYPYTTEEVPTAIRGIMRIWAAALLLQREYGYNTDATDTSRDGLTKAKYAESLLDVYIANGGCSGGDGGDGGSSDGIGAVDTESRGDFAIADERDLRRSSCYRGGMRFDDTGLHDGRN